MSAEFAKSLKSLTIGTNILVLVAIIFKISKCKLLGPGPITHPAGKSLVPVTKFVIRDISVQFFLVTFVYIVYTMVSCC